MTCTIYPTIKKDFNKQCSPQGLESNYLKSNATIITRGAPSSAHVIACVNGQTYQGIRYRTARPLEGWLDNGWPGKGIFPHTVAYCSGMCILAGGFGGGTGDGCRARVDHVRYMCWRHECGSRAFMVKSRRVSPRSCIELVSGMRDLAEEFQSGGVRSSNGSECGCKK